MGGGRRRSSIFTLETVFSHDLDDDKEAVSPLTTTARILSDDPHASAILMMPTACHRLMVPVTHIELRLGKLQLGRQTHRFESFIANVRFAVTGLCKFDWFHSSVHQSSSHDLHSQGKSGAQNCENFLRTPTQSGKSVC